MTHAGFLGVKHSVSWPASVDMLSPGSSSLAAAALVRSGVALELSLGASGVGLWFSAGSSQRVCPLEGQDPPGCLRSPRLRSQS